MKYLFIIAMLLVLTGCDHEYRCRNWADNIQYYQSCMDDGTCKLNASEHANYKRTIAFYKEERCGYMPSNGDF